MFKKSIIVLLGILLTNQEGIASMQMHRRKSSDSQRNYQREKRTYKTRVQERLSSSTNSLEKIKKDLQAEKIEQAQEKEEKTSFFSRIFKRRKQKRVEKEAKKVKEKTEKIGILDYIHQVFKKKDETLFEYEHSIRGIIGKTLLIATGMGIMVAVMTMATIILPTAGLSGVLSSFIGLCTTHLVNTHIQVSTNLLSSIGKEVLKLCGTTLLSLAIPIIALLLVRELINYFSSNPKGIVGKAISLIIQIITFIIFGIPSYLYTKRKKEENERIIRARKRQDYRRKLKEIAPYFPTKESKREARKYANRKRGHKHTFIFYTAYILTIAFLIGLTIKAKQMIEGTRTKEIEEIEEIKETEVEAEIEEIQVIKEIRELNKEEFSSKVNRFQLPNLLEKAIVPISSFQRIEKESNYFYPRISSSSERERQIPFSMEEEEPIYIEEKFLRIFELLINNKVLEAEKAIGKLKRENNKERIPWNKVTTFYKEDPIDSSNLSFLGKIVLIACTEDYRNLIKEIVIDNKVGTIPLLNNLYREKTYNPIQIAIAHENYELAELISYNNIDRTDIINAKRARAELVKALEKWETTKGNLIKTLAQIIYIERNAKNTARTTQAKEASKKREQNINHTFIRLKEHTILDKKIEFYIDEIQEKGKTARETKYQVEVVALEKAEKNLKTTNNNYIKAFKRLEDTQEVPQEEKEEEKQEG